MNKKIYFILILFIVFCLSFITFRDFREGILILLHLTDIEEKAETMTKEEISLKLEETTAPDWWITYWMPSCYIPLSDEDIETIGSIRIHWGELIPGDPIEASQMAGYEIIFTGTFDGQHLEMTDSEFAKKSMAEPFKISADFSNDFETFAGTYTAKFNYQGGAPYNGCPADGSISGEVTAKPCKNIDGAGCP